MENKQRWKNWCYKVNDLPIKIILITYAKKQNEIC